MTLKLKKAEKCPIHGGYFCCGRQRPQQKTRPNPYARMGEAERQAAIEKRRLSKMPVQRIDDPHHPRGYRELCNREEQRRRLLLKVAEQNGRCAAPAMGGCGQEFDDFRGIELDHIEPRGMGGARRDDHIENLQALCATCNRRKGSVRL